MRCRKQGNEERGNAGAGEGNNQRGTGQSACTTRGPVRREELSKQIAEAAKAIGIHGSGSAHSFRKAGGNAI